MKIYIIGGGFAGISAAKTLKKMANDKNNEITLIDKYEYTTMLPSLPDVAGGKINKEFLTESISRLIPENIKFLKAEIISVDFTKKQILTSSESINYDLLLFAPGSKTNFYGFNDNLDKIYTLENLNDSIKIYEALRNRIVKQVPTHIVISGAGFTGIELACNLFKMAKKYNFNTKISLIEKGSRIVPGISNELVDEIEKEADFLGFRILKNDFVTAFDGDKVILNSGEEIHNAFFCWCSGVKVSIPVIGEFDKLGDDRIITNEFLQIPSYLDVFVAGDSAAFKHKNNFLRRSVNYAAMMGKVAAKNIQLKSQNKLMTKFKPYDLGWVIPINLTSVGVAMGLNIKGRLGILMHYIICGIKNYNAKNFFKYVISAFKFATEKYK